MIHRKLNIKKRIKLACTQRKPWLLQFSLSFFNFFLNVNFNKEDHDEDAGGDGNGTLGVLGVIGIVMIAVIGMRRVI